MFEELLYKILHIQYIMHHSIENKIKNSQCDKLIIIVCDNTAHRKIIHQYLENTFPNIKKTSLKSKLFQMEHHTMLNKCNNCDYKKVKMNYNFGFSDNNIDQHYSGICKKCNENNIWNCDYGNNDNVVILYNNNIIVIGDYLKNWNKPKYAKSNIIPSDEFNAAILNKEIYQISSPNQILNRNKLQEHIDNNLIPVLN